MSNVSEITQQLMDLIQLNSDLRDVWMQVNFKCQPYTKWQYLFYSQR